jgi:hypothetical protein
MSLYGVATLDPTLNAEVGWEPSLGSFWFYVTDAQGNRVASGGLDAYEEADEVKRLVTLYDLIEASTGVIDWPQEDLVLRRLRDDPWAERTKVAGETPTGKLLSQTFGSVA